jgi:inhibitor of KinA sporulation pathway (predicted exonuclease)
MKLLVLDLELNLNQDEGNSPTSVTTDIIQIGACILNTENGEILDTFERLISLRTAMDNGELRLSTYIEKLTGIKQSDIDDNGVDFLDAYDDLIDFAKKHEALNIPVTWGSGDMDEIYHQIDNSRNYFVTEVEPENMTKYTFKVLRFNNVVDGKNVPEPVNTYERKVEYYFGTARPARVFDAKKMYQLYMIMNGKNYRGGLRSACNKFGLTVEANKTYHNALTDAIQTARIFYKLSEKMRGV